MTRWVLMLVICGVLALPANAETLISGAKITGIGLGFLGMNGFNVATRAGTGPCPTMFFFPKNFPYPGNLEAAADTAQFDRVFAALLMAYVTGLRVTVVGIDSSCNSAYALTITR